MTRHISNITHVRKSWKQLRSSRGTRHDDDDDDDDDTCTILSLSSCCMLTLGSEHPQNLSKQNRYQNFTTNTAYQSQLESDKLHRKCTLYISIITCQ